MVAEVNEKKQKAAAAKAKKAKKAAHVRHHEPKAADIVIGKYTIRKATKPKFPMTPWEVFGNGNDKPVARCQDKLQAEQYVEQLQTKDAAKDAHSGSPSAAQHDEEIRKQREASGERQYDAG